MDAVMLFAAAAAIRGHFLDHPDLVATAQEIHNRWNAWPNHAVPLAITEAALAILEAERFIEQAPEKRMAAWRLSKHGPSRTIA